ncbi:hypothetical protein [Helicobacter canis]|nr:hypothetical protein [Helicobacter canis]
MRIDCAIFRAVITAKVTPTLKTAQSNHSPTAIPRIVLLQNLLLP